MVTTIVNVHMCVQSWALKAYKNKFITTNITNQIETSPTIPFKALYVDLI